VPSLSLAARVASRADLIRASDPRAALAHHRLADRLALLPVSPHATVNARIWSDAAGELGAEVIERERGLLEIRGDGGRSTWVWRHVTELDGPVALRLALERSLVHRRLADAGVVTPEHVEAPVTRPAPARVFVAADGGRYVVKPASGTSGGSGVTCAVQSRGDLLRAWLAAARFDSRIVVEREVPGDMYRVLLLDGEPIGAVRRRPPSVRAYGRSTLARLIVAENRRRLAAGGSGGLALLRPDLDCVLTLRAQGLGLRAVPPEGATVAVKTSSSENAPQENEVVRVDGSEGAVRDAVAAAAALGLRLAGVDLVTTDLSRGLRATGGAVVEVNGTPGLHYHYLVADPDRAVRVAVPVLRALLAGTGGGLGAASG